MATIRRRNKKYQVIIRKKIHKNISKTFNNLRAARKWANHLEDRIELGEKFYQSNKDMTLEEVISRYLNEITPSKRGCESETRRIRRLLKEPICKGKVCLLQTKDFIEFRDKRIKDGNRTCHYDLVLLRHIFNVAIKQWNLFDRDNPLVNVPKPKLNPSRQRRLTQAEYNFLVRGNYPQKTLRDIIEIAIESAMRKSEILNIKSEHIKEQTLFIPHTKTGSPRTIPLTKRALYILENTQHLPFPMSANALRLAWDRLKKKGNIKDLHFHDLRHESVSKFFERGLSIPEVALISGHKDFRMLFRYTHLKPKDILRKL